jgi:BirA family biotin operon repressor/biotin-[acetyl-CoA-carboxylase] ligase
MLKDYLYISKTHSTNVLLKEKLRQENLPEFFAVRTAFQTAGKGQIGNSWESEKGKNLLFSILLYPHHIAIDKQFVISQIVSVAIIRILNEYCNGFEIKWPNDIYFGNKKIGGILIENSLRASQIEYSIIGIGLNINQKVFKSNAPNPISLAQIIGKNVSVKTIFSKIIYQIKEFYQTSNYDPIKENYLKNLFRGTGIYRFKTPQSDDFEASIYKIEDDGQLILKTKNNAIHRFYFKEVEFVL